MEQQDAIMWFFITIGTALAIMILFGIVLYIYEKKNHLIPLKSKAKKYD